MSSSLERALEQAQQRIGALSLQHQRASKRVIRLSKYVNTMGYADAARTCHELEEAKKVAEEELRRLKRAHDAARGRAEKVRICVVPVVAAMILLISPRLHAINFTGVIVAAATAIAYGIFFCVVEAAFANALVVVSEGGDPLRLGAFLIAVIVIGSVLMLGFAALLEFIHVLSIWRLALVVVTTVAVTRLTPALVHHIVLSFTPDVAGLVSKRN